ncbi:hypothetical protein [Niallia sp. RD1]|nr:hypothetical protein [Niallia sp. RD1]
MEQQVLTKGQLERYEIFHTTWKHYLASGLVKCSFEQWLTPQAK